MIVSHKVQKIIENAKVFIVNTMDRTTITQIIMRICKGDVEMGLLED